MISIKDKKQCCGCSACMNACPINCISMVEDEEGFRYPHVDTAKCINCGKCERVCPIINVEPEEKFEQKAFLIRNMDEQILKESTSGGAFTAIAKEIIDAGGVVFGAAFDDQFEVHHTYVEKYEDLKIFRNSKYVQSNIESTYKEAKAFLDAGRQVLYSGTPCQVEGFWHFIGRRKYENLILIDVVCRAVPSPLVWRKYREFGIKNSENTLQEAAFRDKNKYGYQYSQIRLKFSDGEVREAGVESDPYLRAFFSNLSDRPSCYECKFKKKYRVSDITIWDCFDVYLHDKSFDDNKGVTRALAHSEKGRQIIENLKNCKIIEITADAAVRKANELVNTVRENPSRNDFFIDLGKMEFDELVEKWFPDSLKVKSERFIRENFEKLGIYRPTKRVVRKLLGKE